jgi:hypothetical protein
VVDVCNAVDDPDDSPLERRRLRRPGVIEDSVADLRRQVEPATVALDVVDDSQRMLVVAKAAAEVPAELLVEAVLPGVAERRMAEVVPQPDRLDEVLVESERARDGPLDARGLECVRQAGAEVVVRGVDPDLGLIP